MNPKDLGNVEYVRLQPQNNKKNGLKKVGGGHTKQVYDAFIISSEESDGVFKEEHEGCIDDSIRQLVGIDLKGCSQHTNLSHSFFTAVLLTCKSEACVCKQE